MTPQSAVRAEIGRAMAEDDGTPHAGRPRNPRPRLYTRAFVKLPECEETAVSESEARIAILMGSANDYAVMKAAEETLAKLGIASDVRVISAHRTPDRLVRFLADAEERGLEAIICGAGAAAHLAGVTAAQTLLPVLGVPIDSSPLQGLDALLATVQMPGGIPVATFAIGTSGAKNAALFAAAMLARKDPEVRKRLAEFREEQAAKVPERP